LKGTNSTQSHQILHVLPLDTSGHNIATENSEMARMTLVRSDTASRSDVGFHHGQRHGHTLRKNGPPEARHMVSGVVYPAESTLHIVLSSCIIRLFNVIYTTVSFLGSHFSLEGAGGSVVSLPCLRLRVHVRS